MKKKTQILVILIIFLMSLQIWNYSFASNSINSGTSRPGSVNSISSGSQTPTSGNPTSSGSQTTVPGSLNAGPTTGSGSHGNTNTLVTGSGSHGNTNTVLNNRPSTGIQLNGKGSQTSVPSGSVNPDNYEPSDLTTAEAGEFINIANSIIAAIRIFGTVVAVVVLIVLGIKYMLGSVQDKAGYKETMIPYLVGAVMVFAIPNIVWVIFDLVRQIKF